MGKVVVVDVYPDITVRASNIEVPLPSIIALTDYVPQKNHKPAFTRRNVFLRDEYRCQYCGNHFHTADLSLDHVVPRSKGGVLSWYVFLNHFVSEGATIQRVGAFSYCITLRFLTS